MPTIIPAGFLMVVHDLSSSTFESGAGAVTYGVDVGGAGDNQTATGLLHTAFTTEVMPAMDSSIGCTGTRTYSAAFSFQAGPAVQGGASRTLPAPNTALLVRKVTARRGRRAQGRFFLPGLVGNNNFSEAGLLTPEHMTSMSTVLSDWYNAIIDAGMLPVILQGDEGSTPPLDPPPPVTSFQVQQRLATQRRRLRQ